MVYSVLFEQFANQPWLFILVKFLLAMLLLFPPAFFMGGTFPVMSQFVVGDSFLVGQKVSMLYGINTLGAATGALIAGFYLPREFGYLASYTGTIVFTLSIGLVALLVSYRRPDKVFEPAIRVKLSVKAGKADISMSVIRSLAFLSGFGTLALQVLWTRMFAQVLQNSVYTFATILVVFLVCLSIGAAIANYLIRTKADPLRVLYSLFVLGAILVAATPYLLVHLTNGLQYVGEYAGWNEYIIEVLVLECAIMALPVLTLGAIFPYLLKTAKPFQINSGKLVGQLSAMNTVGAIAGSLAAGFLLLSWVGVWSGIRLISLIYLLAAAGLIVVGEKKYPVRLIMPATGLFILLSILDTSALPVVRVVPDVAKEQLLEAWESSSGTQSPCQSAVRC